MMKHHRIAVGVAVGVLTFGTSLLWPVRALAITINITYCHENFSSSEQNHQTGETIRGIFNAAAAIWEDHLPNSGVYNICVSWDDDLGSSPTGQVLGSADPVSGDIDLLANPSTPWFIDNTPLDHSEFTLIRLEANSFSQAEINAFFNGSVHPLLERGFSGPAKGGSAASGKNDALSIALHEMGHILGVNSVSGDTWNPPLFQTGGQLTIIDNPPSDDGHIAAPSALMFTSIASSRRILPSSIDILAVADDEGFTSVDLPRQAFMMAQANANEPDFSWHTGPFFWEGGTVPGSDDQARITNTARVSLQSGDATVASFVMSGGGRLNTLGRNMTVNGLTDLSGTMTDLTEVVVGSGGQLETEGLEISGATLTLDGGTVRVDQQIEVKVGGVSSQPGVIAGNGTIEAAAGMLLRGLVRAESGSTNSLLLTTSSTDPVWNFGLFSDAELEAVDGDLSVSGMLDGPTKATMTVGSGHVLSFSEPWELHHDGSLKLNGSPNGMTGAILSGASATLGGDVVVDKRGDVFTTGVTFNAKSDVLVPDLNDHLKLFSSTVYLGGNFQGSGKIEQIGNAHVQDNTTIETRIYDWDGDDANPSDTVIAPGIKFTIDSEFIDEFSSDGYDGEIEVGGGTLEVNTTTFDEDTMSDVPEPWSLDPLGRINLIHGNITTEGGGGNGAEVRGSPIDVQGKVFVNGPDNKIFSDTKFFPTADVDLFSEQTHLHLNGEIAYLGGSYEGDGTIHQNGNATTQSSVQIEVNTYDLDGDEGAPSTTTVLSSGRMDLIVGAIDTIDGDGFDGLVQMNNGTLVVQTGDLSGMTPQFHAWSLDPGGHLNLFNGSAIAGNSASLSSLVGSEMVVAGQVSATGPANTIFSPTK